MLIGWSNFSYLNWTKVSIGFITAVILLRISTPKNKNIHFLYFIFLFIQLGFFSIKINNDDILEVYTTDRHQIQCKIIELQKGEKKWNKGIAQIQYLYDRESVETKCDDQLLFYTDQLSSTQLDVGDIILLESEIQQIKNKGNPGEFDAESYWKSKNTYFMSFFVNSDFIKIHDAAAPFKNRLTQAITNTLKQHIQKKHFGIVKALFLGDKSSLDQEIRNSFSTAGAMHLLAISGLHIGLFVALIFSFLKLFSKFISRNMALLISLVFIWFYAYIIDFPPSVLRSVLMFTVLSVGYFINGMKNQINILFFSGTLLILMNPLYLMDIGFQLSYAAMTGIILLYPYLSQLYRPKNKFFKNPWNATALCLSAQLFTFPICLYYFHQFPNYFLLTNLGIVLLAGITVGIGALLIITLKVPLAPLVVAPILSFILFLLIGFIQWIEQLPGALAKGFLLKPIEMIFLIIGSFLIYWTLVHKKNPLSGGIVGVIVMTLIATHHYRQLHKNHIVLFNSNKFSCAIHVGNKTYFIHDNLKEKKYKGMLQDYDRCYPGELKVISLGNQNLLIENNLTSIQFLKNEKDFSIEINSKLYKICYSQIKPTSSSIATIGLPWVKGADIRLNRAYFFHF